MKKYAEPRDTDKIYYPIPSLLLEKVQRTKEFTNARLKEKTL